MHSDVVANPGFTYSPAKTAPNDRVDFIFYKGEKVQPVSSEAHGQETGPNNKAPNQWNNAWPSDHYAVSAEFEIKA